MAIIPLKQTIKIERPGERDSWGRPIRQPESMTLKCRVDEGSQTVQNSIGEEVVVSLEIKLDKLADVRYSDEIEYTNELGNTVKRKPTRIDVIRMISGKPVMTVVFV